MKSKIIVTLMTPLHGEVDIPLGLLYIASMLRSVGVEVRIVDLNLIRDIELSPKKSPELYRMLLESDAIGFSSFKSTIKQDITLMVEIAKEFEKRGEEKLLFAGGWGPTIMPKIYLKYSPIKIIFLGVHGQPLNTIRSLPEILQNMEISLSKIEGIAYKKSNGEIIVKNISEVPEKLKPLDWRILLDIYPSFKKYIEDDTIVVPFIGCLAPCPKYYVKPCIYCSIGRIIQEYKAVYGEKYHVIVKRLTKLDLERLKVEMKKALDFIQDYMNVKRVCFMLVDDTITPRNFELIYNMVKEEGIMDAIDSFKFQTRVDYVGHILDVIDEKDLEKIIVDVGIEFYSDNDLNVTRRGYSKIEIKQSLRKISSKEPIWTAYMILSTPWSKSSDIEDNIRLALELAYKAYLVRCNPYLLEEYTGLECEIKEFKYENVEIHFNSGVKVFSLKVRPRFQATIEELGQMLKIVLKYIKRVDQLINKLGMLVREISLKYKDDMELPLEAQRKILTYISLLELRESLDKLLSALKEDIVYKVTFSRHGRR